MWEELTTFSVNVHDIPLPDDDPLNACNTLLPSSTFQRTLTSGLSDRDCSLNVTSSDSVYVAGNISITDTHNSNVKINEQCYELRVADKEHGFIYDNKCYQLSDTCINDSVDFNHKIVPPFLVKSENMVDHKKKLSILTSTETVQSIFAATMQHTGGLHMKVDDDVKNIFDSPVSKSFIKTEIGTIGNSSPLKRLHPDDHASQDGCTPKKKVQKSYESMDRWNTSESYQKLSTSWKKSLPIGIDALRFKKEMSNDETDYTPRRKSAPLEKSLHSTPLLPIQKRSCTADQTPYTVDLFQRRKRARLVLPYYNAFELITLKSEAGFIDSHCHLDFLFHRQNYNGTYADYQKQHQGTFPLSYSGCLAIFCNPFTFQKDYMWGKYLEEENVWASFGCHPHNANDYNNEIERSLCAALEHSKVRALGEIGLDYSNRNNCVKEKQFEVFRRQLKIALKRKLPVVIHCREAHADGMEIIKEILPKDYMIHLHCFTDTWDWAQKWLEEFPNLFIGITNVVTFPTAEPVHEVARNIPLTRLLLETDSPYFVPKMIAKRTKFSHPGMALHVAAQIAVLRDIPLEQVLNFTRKNTKCMYNI